LGTSDGSSRIGESFSKFLHLCPQLLLEVRVCLLKFRSKRRGLRTDIHILESSNAMLEIVEPLFESLGDFEDLIERQGKSFNGCLGGHDGGVGRG
jgi:hypothetical protein